MTEPAFADPLTFQVTCFTQDCPEFGNTKQIPATPQFRTDGQDAKVVLVGALVCGGCRTVLSPLPAAMVGA